MRRTWLTHERLALDLGAYAKLWRQRARAVEHQFVDHAWLVPLADHIARQELPVTDGFAIDALLGDGARFDASDSPPPRTARAQSLALFANLRRYGRTDLALREELRAPMVERAREEFLTVAAEFEGHPSQRTLTFYRTRSTRGVASYSTGLLGTRAEVLSPGASNGFALAALSASWQARRNAGVYRATFEALAPDIGLLPTTADTPRRPPHLPRAWRSDLAVDAHLRRLANGPFAGLISPELDSWLSAPERPELPGDLRLGLEGIGLLHSWWRRYRDRLNEVSVADLIG